MSSTSSKNNDTPSTSLPQGASQLLGLFAPPKEEEEEALLSTKNDETTPPRRIKSAIAIHQNPESEKLQQEEEVVDEAPASPGSTQHLLNLFASHDVEKQKQLPLHFEPLNDRKHSKTRSFGNPTTPQTTNHSKRHYDSIPPPPPPPPFYQQNQHHRRMESIPEIRTSSTSTLLHNKLRHFRQTHLTLSTLVGGCIFLFYHVVFGLAMASTIPTHETLGTMLQMIASGVIFTSPIFIHALGKDIPSQWPTTDLFLAPFMAHLANIVQQHTNNNTQDDYTDDETSFLPTFSVLCAIGLLGSAFLIFLATTFKLANLGSYLPFPVLCGFFSAIGVLLWTLAISVDTGGKTVAQVLHSRDDFLHMLLHHTPSLGAGIIMKTYAPVHPLLGLGVLGTLTLLVYSTLWMTNTTWAEAQNQGWFWTAADLDIPPTRSYQSPLPLGYWLQLHQVHWTAVQQGLPTAAALSFLYLLRCSLHATALKRNVVNLKRQVKVVLVTAPVEEETWIHPTKQRSNNTIHRRRFTEDVDLEAIQNHPNKNHNNHNSTASTTAPAYEMVSPPNPTISLQTCLIQYSLGQCLTAALGSFAVTPSIAVMQTMYSLGSYQRAPQYLSLILYFLFYLSDFKLVAYIPKMAFSSLVVVGFLDMVSTFFVQSWFKTREKMEWLVVPVIVVAAFWVGLLFSVFLGIAVSTFLFVAAFFRSGVVKYLANGLAIRSTIERSMDAASWLDTHGDKIQVVVLQNYLFFGNASSMLNYISSMFDEPKEGDEIDFVLPPLPKYIVLDLTLVTGMDTSTVDVFNDIKTICVSHGCKVFVAGLSPALRETLALCNFKPEAGERSKRNLRFFADLDTAMGKAEDYLVEDEMIQTEEVPGGIGGVDNEETSFQRALRAIDTQHSGDYAMDLSDLYPYTVPIELDIGECLYECEGGPVSDSNRGLFFIESGLMKIERDSGMSLTRGSMIGAPSSSGYDPRVSLSSMQARTGSMGKQAAMLKSGARRRQMETSIRLARLGPGWVVGTLEGVGATQYPSHHVAVSKCKMHHLPYHRIEEIEEKDPKLVLRLYKLLSHLMARRQELAIGQLVTLHSIMTAAPARKPIGRISSKAHLSFD